MTVPLLAWPKFEIFQLSQDTVTYYGDLKPLLPEVSRKDIEDSVKISTSAIYHYAANSYISGDEQTRADGLKPLYKPFFFMMQVIHYLRSGEFIKTKKELTAKLTGDEAEMLKLGSDLEYFAQVKKDFPDSLFQKLLDWSAKTLRENF